MVRCVNTGVSMQVDSCGRVVTSAGQSPDAPNGVINQPAWMLANVRIDDRGTLFGRMGDVFPIVCSLIGLGVFVVTFVRPRRAGAGDHPGVVE